MLGLPGTRSGSYVDLQYSATALRNREYDGLSPAGVVPAAIADATCLAIRVEARGRLRFGVS